MINSWTCYNCNLYNDILTSYCKDCYSKRLESLNQEVINTIFSRFGMRYEGLKTMADSDKIELHTKFFNNEKVLYSAMNIEQRIAHRSELASLIFEARARMNAVDEVDREEKGKLSKDGRSWLVSNQEVNVSDAINQPKIRKERMSKGDKLKESMSNLGLDTSMINSIMGKVSSSATESDLNKITFVKSEPKITSSELCRINQHEACTGSFRNESGSHECECHCHKVVANVAESEVKPFNPASLFGAK